MSSSPSWSGCPPLTSCPSAACTSCGEATGTCRPATGYCRAPWRSSGSRSSALPASSLASASAATTTPTTRCLGRGGWKHDLGIFAAAAEIIYSVTGWGEGMLGAGFAPTADAFQFIPPSRSRCTDTSWCGGMSVVKNSPLQVFCVCVCFCHCFWRPHRPHRVSSIIDFNLRFPAAAVHQVDLVLSCAHSRSAPAYSCVSRLHPERL